MQRLKGLLALLLLAIGLALGGGCETSEGFGRDVEDLGEEIQEEARESK